MSFFAGLVTTMSSLTAVSPPSSCTALQYIRCAAFLTGFAMDTVLGLNGLLIFLVSSVAVTIFACSLLTIASCLILITAALTIYRMHEAHSAFLALGPGLALPDSCAGFWQAIQIARHGPIANGAGYSKQCLRGRVPRPTPSAPLCMSISTNSH
jgi:hypothetical protein